MAERFLADRFAGRVALVTGAGSGIGRAAALRLAREGAAVYCADVNESAARTVAAEAGARASPLGLDVTDEDSWIAAIDSILARSSRLDLMVNSAGISAGAPLPEMSFADWRRVLSVNLDGAFLATKHCLRVMRSAGGSIVHVSSASAIKPATGAAAYSAGKAGLCMLAKTAARECRDNGWPVRENTVCPAGVKTPLWTSMPFFQELTKQTGSEEAAFASLAAGSGGPFAEPEEIVGAILFLCSDEARFVTGTDLVVDGGHVL